jgi:hypothetical protein
VIALLFVCAALGIFGLARQKLPRIPTIPTSESCPTVAPTLAPMSAYIINVQRSPIDSQGSVTAQSPAIKAGLCGILICVSRGAARGRPSSYHEICGAPDDRNDGIAAETLVTQNARPLKSFDSLQRTTCPARVSCETMRKEIPNAASSEMAIVENCPKTASRRAAKAKRRLEEMGHESIRNARAEPIG